MAHVSTQPTTLPSRGSAFIGRAHDLAELTAWLTSPSPPDGVHVPPRLITLTGPSGSGKTRLALQLAHTINDLRVIPANSEPANASDHRPSQIVNHKFADGLWWVDLAALTDPTLIPQVVASVLGVREPAGRSLTAALTDHLRGQSGLLILDNCEHVIEASATLVGTLLRHCPGISILATSQSPLAIAGESLWPVTPLALPAASGTRPPTDLDTLLQSEAIQLFVTRAGAAQADFYLTPLNAPAIAHLCRRLDGLPLAIELAAARVRTLTPDQIAARLDATFGLLTSDRPDTPPRHKSLWAAIEWSYGLLAPAEQTLLNRLAIFTGSFNLEAVEEIIGDWGVGRADTILIPKTDILDRLTSLVDKSLVVTHSGAGATRYRLLEMVRHYSLDKLDAAGETTGLRHRHAVYYLTLTETADAELQGARQAYWLGQLDTEYDNLRGALRYALDAIATPTLTEPPPSTLAIRMVAGLVLYWNTRGFFSEGRHWLDEALARSADRTRHRARALQGASTLAWSQDDVQAAAVYSQAGLALARELGEHDLTAASLNSLGILAQFRGEYAAARAFYTEALTLRRALGQPHSIAGTLHNLALLAQLEGDYLRARAYDTESLALRRQIGAPWGIAITLHSLAETFVHLDELDAARLLYVESLDLMRSVQNAIGEALVLQGMAKLALAQRLLRQAYAYAAASLSRSRGGNAWVIHGTLLVCLGLEIQAGMPERAVQLAGALAASLARAGRPFDAADQAIFEARASAARASLDAAQADGLRQAGQRMTLDDAVDFALAFDVTWLDAPSDPPVAIAPIDSGDTSVAQDRTPRQAAKAAYGGLTAREREIAALVAEGLTNEHIGRRLSIAAKTVERHMGNILSKLGYTNRTEVAAWAVANSLAHR